MVHKLTNKEIAGHWNELMKSLRIAFKISEAEEKILFNLAILDKVQVWFGYAPDDLEHPIFLAVTGYTNYFAQTDKLLMIDYLISLTKDKINLTYWKDGFAEIKKFAKEKDCKKIVCTIDKPHLYDLLKQIADVKVRVALEVEV